MSDYQWLMNSGFAAMVAWYVLARLEPAIRELNRTVGLLAVIVAQTNGMDYDAVKAKYQGVDKP